MSQCSKQAIIDNREALEALAESDLRSAKYARILLEEVEGITSYPNEESKENDIQVSTGPQKPTKAQIEDEGIFAF